MKRSREALRGVQRRERPSRRARTGRHGVLGHGANPRLRDMLWIGGLKFASGAGLERLQRDRTADAPEIVSRSRPDPRGRMIAPGDASAPALDTPGARTTREEMAIRPPCVTLRRPPPTAAPAFDRKPLTVAGPPAGTEPGQDLARRTRVADAPTPAWRRGSSRDHRRENPGPRPAPVLSVAGDAAGRADGARVPQRPRPPRGRAHVPRGRGRRDSELPDLPDSAASQASGTSGPGFSLKKVVCDAVMFVECLRMVRRNRYDLIHAVEESAFIAAAARGCPACRTSTTWTRRWPSRWWRPIRPSTSCCRSCATASRWRCAGASGVLTVCAALEDVALATARASRWAGSRTARCCSGLVRPEDQQRLRARCPRRSARGAGRDVRRQSGALPGHRPDARRLPPRARRVPDASLVIVGGREEDIQHYQRVAARLGILPRVHFLGPGRWTCCPPAAPGRRARLAPVKGLNTPMKIYSYLDSGTAVLATRLRTHTQVLDDRSAYLVDPEPEASARGWRPC